jgi:hypothetical protein
MATQQAIGETGRISAMGIPWYGREDYLRIRKIMADGGKFPEAYDDWLHRAEAVERRIAASGVLAIRAMIDPERFLIWCKIRALKCNSQARGSFAAEKARDAIC